MMIWTDWGKSIIEKSSLDGSNRETLVKRDIGYPNGVTIDYDHDIVYWCDAQRDIISSVHLDGKKSLNYNPFLNYNLNYVKKRRFKVSFSSPQ